jgi:lantibiotic modifying enzyme
MEQVRSEPCRDQNAARRFYRRVGGMLGAAYLLKAVDCHRDNIIAAGEYPVLIDAETLWHVARETKTQSVLDVLYGTGFLPSSGRRSSWQSRSSALGRTSPGQHTPRIAAKPLSAASYETEIVNGFRRAWRCLLGTTERRAAFFRRLQRLRRRERRWIYRSTRKYDAIRRASIQPAALRSGIGRDLFIARSCARSGVSQGVVQKEMNALRRLDIPYFTRKAAGPSFSEKGTTPKELVDALRRAVHL